MHCKIQSLFSLYACKEGYLRTFFLWYLEYFNLQSKIFLINSFFLILWCHCPREYIFLFLLCHLSHTPNFSINNIYMSSEHWFLLADQIEIFQHILTQASCTSWTEVLTYTVFKTNTILTAPGRAAAVFSFVSWKYFIHLQLFRAKMKFIDLLCRVVTLLLIL